jgi:hypothetical protein
MAAERISRCGFRSNVPMNVPAALTEPCWEVRETMKTLHLHRHAPPPAPSTRPAAPATPPRPVVRASTVRLGIIVSAVAAVVAIVLEAILDVPALLILVPVVIVGFVLSWQASGRPEGPPPE